MRRVTLAVGILVQQLTLFAYREVFFIRPGRPGDPAPGPPDCLRR